MKFLVFPASYRKASFNRKLAVLATEFLCTQGHEVDFAEYKELELPILNNETDGPPHSPVFPDAVNKVAERIKAVDGVIVSTAEFNWSMPGSLKNIFDWLSVMRPVPLEGKNMLVMCASPSLKGALLSGTELQRLTQKLGMYTYPGIYTLSLAHQAFDGEKLKDPKQMELLENMLKSYSGMVKKLT